MISKSTKPYDGAQGLQVYRRNYQQGHIEALEYKYPGTLAAIGVEGFRYAAYHFLQKHPPIEEDIVRFGDIFPDFLESHQDFQEYPQLVWIARLDLWFFDKKPCSSLVIPYGTVRLRSLLMEDKSIDEEWDVEKWEAVEYDESATHYRSYLCE